MQLKTKGKKSLNVKGIKFFQGLFVLVILISLLGVKPPGEVLAQDETKIALISDYGVAISDSHKSAIATLIKNWAPDAVVTGGDNYHDRAPSCSSYAECVAGYNNYTEGYTDFVTSQTFFPSYGNHDAMHSTAYISYFNYLPSDPDPSHLYYDVKIGNIHFWVLNGNVNLSGSAQQTWLAANAPDTTAAWNIAVVHQAPYGTGFYGDLTATQIPYQNYGIDFVISGHNHHYERLVKDGIRYFIAGRAGATEDRSCDGTGSAATSEFCAGTQTPAHNNYGYMQIVATETDISLSFIGENGALVDTWAETTEEPTDPVITVSPNSLSFTSQPAVPSDAKSYTVSGVRLQGNVTITPPSGFEISQSSGSGFSATPISLVPVSGTLSETPIYVRLNRATTGISSGNITNASLNAATKNVAVTGTASETVSDWIAYNDLVWRSGQPSENITQYTISSEGTATGLLVDYATGSNTPVTVTIEESGVQGISGGDDYDGSEANSGTDAYNTFNGIVDSTGLIVYGSSTGWWVDVTFSGLTQGGSYTFATTANRNNSGEDYVDRISRFTISGAESATNASTSGVTVINNESVAFSTGYNTEDGYVARWTGIDPGADGIFKVRAEAHDRNEAYGPSVFMLASEISSELPTITLSSALTPFSTTPGVPSVAQSYSVTGANLAEGIAVTAPTGFEVATAADGLYAAGLTLPAAGGTVFVRLTGAAGSFSGEITHESDGAVTRTLAVSGTTSDEPPTPPWTAYNDMSGTSTPANTTEFTLDQVNGMLKDFETGADTGVTVTVTSEGSPYNYTTGGSMTDSGTDAYDIFNGKVNLEGVIMSATSNETDYWVDVTFNNLIPTKTYTFVATANRAGGTGGTGVPYPQRETLFTISGMDAATNASSSGVTVVNEYSVHFVTGENTAAGYVAKWVNIQPGADGSFKVRAQPPNPEEPRTYAYGAFMLQEEAVQGDTYTLAVSTVGNGSVTLNPSGGIYAADTQVFLTPVPGTGYAFNSWSGVDDDDLVDQGGGTWSIFMDENKAVTANFTVIPNSAPTNILLSKSSVLEGQAIGTFVGTFSAVDPDAGDTHTFSLVAGEGDTDNTSFNINDDQLLTAEEFNFETKSSYSIRVQVTDSDALTFAKAFTISILPIGVTPPLPSSFYGQIQYVEDDDEPEVGDLVQVFLDDETTAIWSTDIEYYAAEDALVYAINVPSYPDSSLPETVTFKIDGRVVATANWISGTNIELDIHPPLADAGGPYVSLVSAGSVALNGTVSDLGSDLSTQNWDFDEDGSFDDSALIDPTFSLSSAGTYPVSLKAVDLQGGEGTDTSQVFAITLSGITGQVYNGSTHPVTVDGVESPYTYRVLYGTPGIETPPTAPGTYVVLVQILSGTEVIGSYETEMVIAKATATVTLGNLEQQYDGSPKPVTVTTIPAGLTVVVTYDGSTTVPSATGSYAVIATVNETNYTGSASGTLVISGLSHSIDLVPGWNLVSFNIIPTSTAIEDVLESINGDYSLVYAWDASGTSNQWRRYDPNVGYGNTLNELDETTGFWIFMNQAATLTVVGNQPTTTEIDLLITAGGWNLIGYPSTLSPDLPGALSEIDGEFTLVYAYQAPDSGDPWKVFDVDAPEWSNDLEAMAPGWGYWIFVTADTSLSVNFE